MAEALRHNRRSRRKISAYDMHPMILANPTFREPFRSQSFKGSCLETLSSIDSRFLMHYVDSSSCYIN